MKTDYNKLRKEFACRCGCGFAAMDILLCHLYEFLFSLTDVDVISGCRCIEHNKREGGHESSYHTKGMALDLSCSNRAYVRFLIDSFCKMHCINFLDVVSFSKDRIHIEIDYNKFNKRFLRG